MEKPLVHSVAILTLINIVDALANSAVNPSLIFYVTEVGGNLKDDGLISSISYFSAMLMMIVYGMWVDSNGNKYKLPYAASFTMGILGSLLYFVAKMLPSGAWAVNTILIGRFITGCGVAGRTLAFSYVATAIPRDQQRTTLTLLAMTRSCGYLMGPLVNLLVAKIDTSISIFNCNVPLNPRNSVGLALAFTESCLMVLTLLFLQDPPPKSNKRGTITAKDKAAKVMVVPRDIWNAVTHFDILFPILIKFVFSCNNSL